MKNFKFCRVKNPDTQWPTTIKQLRGWLLDNEIYNFDVFKAQGMVVVLRTGPKAKLFNTQIPTLQNFTFNAWLDKFRWWATA